jgi:hypothetical protein
MRDFSRERPTVNEEFGNNLAKTMPKFVPAISTFPAHLLKNCQAFGNSWMDVNAAYV